MADERTSKAGSWAVTRLPWMLFGLIEFAITIIVGLPLYLALAGVIYFRSLRGLFERAITVIALRFRVGRIRSSIDGLGTASPLSPRALARDPAQRGRLHSWLN
jgi:hypothetical protein